MKYIITPIIALMLSACSTLTEKEPPIQPVVTKLPNSSEFTEYNSFENNLTDNSYDIEGRYKLERGLYMTGDINRGDITHAYMVIDKLDDNDFGYYFADKLKGADAMSTFGVFHYDEDDKKFHQKYLDGDSYKIRKGGIEIVTDATRLKLTIKQLGGRKIIIWKKVKEDSIGLIDDTIDSALKEAEDSYRQIYESRREEVIDDSSFFGLF